MTINDFIRMEKFIEISKDFNIPIVFFIDNNGLDISYDNELEGIGNAISKFIFKMSSHEEKIISVITGEATSEASIPFFLGDKFK